MQIALEIAYTLRLTASEFRLLTLALAGKKLSKEEAREALYLNERLCDLRVHQIKEAQEVAVGAHQKAAELLQAVEE